MKFHFRNVATALALLAGVGIAAGQTATMEKLQLSQSQKAQIYRTLAAESAGAGMKNAPPQANVNVAVGEALPPTVPLRDIPRSTVAQIPAVAPYKFTVFGDDVAIVEPRSRQIVEILKE